MYLDFAKFICAKCLTTLRNIILVTSVHNLKYFKSSKKWLGKLFPEDFFLREHYPGDFFREPLSSE